VNLDRIKKVCISATRLALFLAAFLAIAFVATVVLGAGYVFIVNRL
jgi:hypothetical protein